MSPEIQWNPMLPEIRQPTKANGTCDRAWSEPHKNAELVPVLQCEHNVT